jgi:glutaminyl-peptide cyclotransferase
MARAALLLALLLWSLPWSLQRYTLGERELPHLSHQQLEAIISHPDPKRAVDLEDPVSHLSKILIPRAGMGYSSQAVHMSDAIL